MNTPLNHIQNWPELAGKANWSAAKLAALCGVSVRTLERHFKKIMGKTPKDWLTEHRQCQAVELLRNNSVKETSSKLGYRHAPHFSRDFKEHWGFCPKEEMASSDRNSGDCRNLV